MNDANHFSESADLTRPPTMHAVALDCKAGAGHFDELRGGLIAPADQQEADASKMIADSARLTGAWGQFFSYLKHDRAADLNRREASLKRQILDNGVSYNVFADAGGPQRPWSLDLFPLIIEPESWQQIEAGVTQRMRLHERVMADVYGPQQLLALGLLPPALVHGHPGYLRPMHGVKPVGGTHLHVAAFDLARGPDGQWWVVSQRFQAPSGLGYLLENRLAISGQFPEAFRSMHVQRLAATYRALMDSLRQMSPAGVDSHLALLTPGPYNETYFEHAYLARYLGLTLVQGSDLIVRDERLFLKTLKGLVPIHGLLKRVDDQYLDPLELRPDSTLGVPGLLQAIRAGNVLVANAPGSAFLESPALLGFLPALSEHLLGESLQLPSLPTWWCGERSAQEDALPRLRELAIKPTYPGSPVHGSFDAVMGRSLSERELDEWAGRIVRQGEEHSMQAYVPISQMPTWQSSQADIAGDAASGLMVPRSVILRAFAVSDGVQSWRVLPGGLARVAGAAVDISSMQRGGSSADVWVLTRGEVDATTLLQPHITPAIVAQRKRMVTSRAAENLYWLGRYSERTENTIRLARLTLECLSGEDQSSSPLLDWLGELAVENTLVLPTVPSAQQARRVFERSLIASLASADGATSVGYNLRALKMTASNVRERFSQEHWRVILQAEDEFFSRCGEASIREDFSSLEALRVLKSASTHMAAITGAQTDRMTRDDGWRLLSIGRHIERLSFLAPSLMSGFKTGVVHTGGGFDAMLELFDSIITFHALYQQSRDLPALLDLLVLDRDNPRSLAWVAHTLRGRLAKLAGSEPGVLSALSYRVPDITGTWSLAQLCETQAVAAPIGHVPGLQGAQGPGYYFELNALLLQCVSSAHKISEEISATYFTHSQDTKQSLGT